MVPRDDNILIPARATMGGAGTYFALVVCRDDRGRAVAIDFRVAPPSLQSMTTTIIVVVVVVVAIVVAVRRTDVKGMVIYNFNGHIRMMRTSALYTMLTPQLLVIGP